MENIKAVIFDVDETLVNRKEAFLRFCEYLIEKYSSKYPYEGKKEELIEYMIKIDEGGYGGIQTFIPRLSEVWTLPHSVEEFVKERNEVFGKMTTPFSELYEVLETLKKKYKLGIITNGYSSVQREKIKTVGIDKYFDDIIVSGEQEFAKPDPRIFQLSCSNLGVKPEEAVFVGDYYPNDIEGAIMAKIMPIWITDHPDEHKEYKGIRITRLKEILELL
jgi:putative hydrolase of the HAD superfamily